MRSCIARSSPDTWAIRFDLPRGVDGRRRQKQITIRGTRKDAEAAAARNLADLSRGDFAEPGRMRVRALLTLWLETRQARVARSTFERYRGIVRDFLEPTLGDVQLDKLTAGHIEKAIHGWRDAPRRDRKHGALSGRTIRHVYATLRTALSFGVRRRLIARSPCDFIEPPVSPRRRVRGLEPHELVTVLHGLGDTMLYVPALVAAFTGLRRGELLGLSWRHVDLDRAFVLVLASVDRDRDGTLRLKEPKTQRSRRAVALPQFVVEELRRHVGALTAHFGTLPEPVFPDWVTGNYADPDRLSSAFYYLIRSRSLPTVSLHGLRHSFRTAMQLTGVEVEVTSDAMGHSSIVTTADGYGMVPRMALIEAASRLHDLFGRQMQCLPEAASPA